MDWVCPRDRAALAREAGGWRCSCCGATYPIVDEIVVFAEPGRAAASRHAWIDELWQALARDELEPVAAAFCAAHGCVRTRFATNWKSFFSPRPGGTTLEIGPGVGDDSLDLAASSGSLLVLAPGLTDARIVKRNLDRLPSKNFHVAVVTDLTRLPLRDGAIDAAAMEDVAAGFEVDGTNLDAFAAELHRVVAPRGSVFVGLANGLHRLPGAALVRRAMRSRPPAIPLNRALKRAGSRTRLSLGRTRESLTRAGFRPSPTYAPLPDADDAQIVLPVDDARAVRYFLNNLIRKNSGFVRAAIRLADLLVSLKLFRYGVPYYYLIFRNEPRQPG